MKTQEHTMEKKISVPTFNKKCPSMVKSTFRHSLVTITLKLLYRYVNAIIFVYFSHGWYWGGITSSEAEELLAGQHDNVFLVRDSYDSRHILCISFRCVGRTLHARLLHANGLFSLDNETFVPAYRLSEHCSAVNVKTNLFEMPVKLARPLNRYLFVGTISYYNYFISVVYDIY